MIQRVYKFGGASVKDAASIRNVADIISKESNLLVVISAMGKTTNGIEAIIKTESREEAIDRWDELCNWHVSTCKELGAEAEGLRFLDEYRLEGRSIIYDYPRENRDEFYDQLISIGELMSTTIVVAYLLETGKKAKWIDARKMLRSDEHFRQANIQWRETESAVQRMVDEHSLNYDILVTQGFIAGTRDGRTTTLGREGSDYTAAILSYCINGESMAVWKDVPGVLTADPRLFPEASLISKLSYKEAIEMTYYGAQVIHPKTIQPIQRKEIPLYVKSFVNPNGPGTEISKEGSALYPPMIVVTPQQYLLQISTKDFSFIAERHLSMLFRKFNHYRIRVNLMRNTAISFTVCVSAEEERLQYLKEDLQYEFNIDQKEELNLITIRHYNQSTVDYLKNGKEVFFEELHDVTYQMVCD